MKTESLLSQARRVLNQYGLRARKGLAQHFLIERGILDSIVDAADLSPADTVIEVGPGLGVLTVELAARAGRVIAVELDARLAEILQESLADHANLTVINRDIMEVDIASLLEEQGLENVPYKVVANLPYYIASAVLRRFLESPSRPAMMLVMVQREVAEAIVARPGDMSILAISVQLYGRPKIVRRVSGDCFYPPPDVDSALLRIDVYPDLAVPVEPESFFELVKAGFCAARKQLVNSLAQGLQVPKMNTLAILEKAAISPERRAETLSLEEWAALWRAWKEAEEKG